MKERPIIMSAPMTRSSDKEPFVVHCRDCSHEWPALYLPMMLAAAAKILQGLSCPMCGSDKLFCGPRPTRAIQITHSRGSTMTDEKQDRFTKIGAGGERLPKDATAWEAVLDNRTGLMWAVDDLKVDRQEEAEGVVKELRAAGFDDWRVPTVEELFPLADRSRHDPAIDTDYFPGCKSDWYWTCTPYAPSPGDVAWGVVFHNGNAFWDIRDGGGFVRAVRASQ